jgi:hypothetical protein
MKTRKDELQDLFIAVRKHLLNCGHDIQEAETGASKFVNDAEKMGTSIEDIRKMRDIFL